MLIVQPVSGGTLAKHFTTEGMADHFWLRFTMISGVENNAAKIVVLINAVSILFAQLPSDKQQQALKVLKGLADCDYAKFANSIDSQKNAEYAKSLSEVI
ncbi:TPA: hypothetical protein ACIO9I_000452 [Salmonella enterica subsp. enterica serovar Potsdam]